MCSCSKVNLYKFPTRLQHRSRSNSLQTTNQKFYCAQNVHHYNICNGFMFNINKSSLHVCHFTLEHVALRTDTFILRKWMHY
jgi:hypothetical protein